MTEKIERKRAPKNTWAFTDLAIRRLKPPKTGQVMHWDEGCLGLSLLVGARTKTFRVQYKLNGKWESTTIGRFGEIVPNADSETEGVQIGEARRKALEYRAKARQGINPKQKEAGAKPAGRLYEDVVKEFIEDYAKPKQRGWDRTQRILTKNCAPWLKKEFASINEDDAYALLKPIKAAGHEPKAEVTLALVKTLWRWAKKRKWVPASVIMDDVEFHYIKKPRDRCWSDDEIKTIWAAANKLEDKSAGAFIKLLILFAPRKTALAGMRWSDLDSELSLWTTPFEFTKSRRTAKKRVYLTPLPPLAQRIIKGLPKGEAIDRVFPTLPIYRTEAGQQWFDSNHLTEKLISHGAPKDFAYHTIRHTIGTWLENKGHSEWERGLVLNHAGSGSVTAGYSHGHATNLKLELLTKWADHVEALVQPEGAISRGYGGDGVLVDQNVAVVVQQHGKIIERLDETFELVTGHHGDDSMTGESRVRVDSLAYVYSVWGGSGSRVER
jgi:integrase